MINKFPNSNFQSPMKYQFLISKFSIKSKIHRKLETGNRKLASGFTLIELLVVISIIGILAALVTVSFTAIQRQARDSNRKSDIKQYQTSLETFSNKNNGLYPSRPDAAGVIASTRLCTDLGLTSCPEDAKNASDATFVYRYQTNGTVSNGSATATNYVVWAKLENTTEYFVVCSNGKAGNKAQSGFTVSGGICPI
jgi:prepilin-type N-terminal cleavage/methylation domain-containing protein